MLNETERCPKCGGELQDGKLGVRIMETGSSRTDPFANAMMLRTDLVTSLGMMGQGGNISVEGPFWQELTGKETGWFSKKKEAKIFSVRGKRCTLCGYIELYVDQLQKQE